MTKFENKNPYSKFGLRRRPTFNEILGLIKEDQTALKPFPDIRATKFRNSPEGSFFDGADSIELLQEQQNRILDRQMREAIMRQEAQRNGSTSHLERHRQNNEERNNSSMNGIVETGTPRTQTMDMEIETSMREQQQQQRRNQVGQAVGENIRRMEQTVMASLLGQKQPVHSMSSDEELVDELGIPPLARQTPQPLPLPKFDYAYNGNTNMRYWRTQSVEAMKFQFFIRGIEVPEINEIPDEELKIKGKGRNRTYKEYLEDLIEDTIDNGGWDGNEPTDEEYKQRLEAWLNKKGKGNVMPVELRKTTKKYFEAMKSPEKKARAKPPETNVSASASASAGIQTSIQSKLDDTKPLKTNPEVNKAMLNTGTGMDTLPQPSKAEAVVMKRIFHEANERQTIEENIYKKFMKTYSKRTVALADGDTEMAKIFLEEMRDMCKKNIFTK